MEVAGVYEPWTIAFLIFIIDYPKAESSCWKELVGNPLNYMVWVMHH